MYLLLALVACLPLVLSVPMDMVEDQNEEVQYTGTFSFGDVRNCPTRSPHNQEPLYRMSVLPGAGFDNLRNVDRGRVHEYNYSLCRVSEDGKYLLPDSVFVVPIKESRFESFAEYFDHWDNYTSTTASSINTYGGVTFIPISGKFSREYMLVKSHQIHDDAKTTRVQMRYNFYKVMLQADSPLHPTFKARLFDIAAHWQNNNTEFAHYLAEVLVRDFGTHFVTSVDAGAVFSLVDHVSSNYVKRLNHETTKISSSASANFFSRFTVGFDYSRTSSREDQSEYLNNRTHSEVFAIGGPPYTSHLTVEEWERGVPNNLVAIDRSGNPLHFAVTPATLPELPEITVREVADVVHKAIETYYEVNSQQGCLDPGSPNFYFQANVNDESCEPPRTNFTFGGVYQTCAMSGSKYDFCHTAPFGASQPLAQTNPLTGDYSCPAKYTPILLYEGKVTHPKAETYCRKKCKRCWLVARCCRTECVNEVYTYQATYRTYWCAALQEVPSNSGYLFGGIYTQKSANQVTGAMNCPAYYLPLRMGRDIKVCVSDDYELGFAHSVNFAGLESCKHGNPLAISKKTPEFNNPNMWPHSCPRGYAQHLVSVEDGCAINYCVQAGSFFRGPLNPAILPPFEKTPYYAHNDSGIQVIIGAGRNIWVKTPEGDWSRRNEDEVEDALDDYMIKTFIEDPTTTDESDSTNCGTGGPIEDSSGNGGPIEEDSFGTGGPIEEDSSETGGPIEDSSGTGGPIEDYSGIGGLIEVAVQVSGTKEKGPFKNLTKEAVFGISVAGTAVLGMLIALVVLAGFCVCRSYQKKRKLKMENEILLRDTSQSDLNEELSGSHYCQVNCH